MDEQLKKYEDPEGLSEGEVSLGEYPIDSLLIRTENRTVYEIIRRIKNGSYVLDPEFQRDFVWDKTKQSRLIESVLMRLPLPVFYLAERNDGKVLVVDGLQRLTTLFHFLEGNFSLSGLGVKKSSELNNKLFKDLPAKLQTRIEDTQLIVFLIDSKVPERAKIDIFERVNSGVPLTRQQMRHAIYTGEATRWLKEQAANPIFLTATARSLDPKSMRDRELINRFCGFYLYGVEGFAAAKADMEEFLALTLQRMNLLDDQKLAGLSTVFLRSMENNTLLFSEYAFRKHTDPNQRRSVINVALFDVFSVAMARLDQRFVSAHKIELCQIFYSLVTDPDFNNAISLATNSLSKVRTRFDKVAEQMEAFYAAAKRTGAFYDVN